MILRRRLHVIATLLLALTTFLFLFACDKGSVQEQSRSQQAATTASSARSMTKSLREMLVGMPELSDHVIFFNRVPKAGGEMLVLLLQWLQGGNQFRHVRLPGGRKRRLSRREQELMVEKVTETLQKEAIPLAFDRHVYFVNFTFFGRQSPMFLNLVRDPVEKLISRFYYARATPNPHNPDLKYTPRLTTSVGPFNAVQDFEQCVELRNPECTFRTGKHYDLSIPYFCGHQKECMVLNSRWALQAAKANVQRYFPVVGVLEELNATLSILQRRLPLFFNSVQEMYFNQLLEPQKNRNRARPRVVNEATRRTVALSLQTEYDFYYWLKCRLLSQLLADNG